MHAQSQGVDAKPGDYPWAGWWGKPFGGPNAPTLKSGAMTCGEELKV